MKLVLESPKNEPAITISLRQDSTDIDILADGIAICFVAGSDGRVYFFRQSQADAAKLQKMGFQIRDQEVVCA